MREHEDERAHVRMDVAEDADDARAIEPDRLRVPDRVASEVERLGLRERKDVVVGVIAVRKIDRRAGHDRQHVRHERLVALIEPRARLVALSNAARGAGSRYTTLRRSTGMWRPPMPTSVTTDRGGSCTVACGTTTRPLIEPVGAGALARARDDAATHTRRAR